tara:strand:+ start:100 stop:507 length:408 start_codon:yes stop_codon:yes gene_type:complete
MFKKKKQKDDRESMNVMVDDGTNLMSGTILHLEETKLVVDSEIEFEPGTPLTIFPMGATTPVRIFELRGEVTQTLPDIMVSAYAKNRFLVSVALEAASDQVAILRNEIERARPASDRPFTEPHRDSLFLERAGGE